MRDASSRQLSWSPKEVKFIEQLATAVETPVEFLLTADREVVSEKLLAIVLIPLMAIALTIKEKIWIAMPMEFAPFVTGVSEFTTSMVIVPPTKRL